MKSSESVNSARRSHMGELGGLFRIDDSSATAGFRQEAQGAFQRKYYDRPDLFVQECIIWGDDEGPAPYQLEVLATLVLKKRISVRAPHGVGKSCVAALTLLWFALTRDGEDWKVVTTASAWRQLINYLWPEVHKWTRRIRWDKVGREPFGDTELLTRSIRLSTGEAFAVASNDAQLIEGAHADQILYVFDEAKAIPADTFDAAEGAFSKGNAFALAISTPGEPLGRFYDIQMRKPGYADWAVRHITLKEAIAAGRVDANWAEQRRLQWGEKSAVYMNRVLGEFASADRDGVIPLSWVEMANERWREWQEDKSQIILEPEEETPGPITPRPDPQGAFICVSADVATEHGRDQSVLALRYQRGVDELRRYPKMDTMELANRLESVVTAKGGYAVPDVIGVGAGVTDRLGERKVLCYSFNASARCESKDRSGELGFINLRSAAWWHLRELLDPFYNPTLALPPDDTLTGDLVAPRYRVLTGSKVQVESKDDIGRRLGRSTDEGDSVVMACAKLEWLRPEQPDFTFDFIEM